MGRLRIFLLWIADLVCVYAVWFAVVWGYKLTGIGQYEPSFYLKVWPIGVVFTGLNALFRLYHGRCLYPAAPHAPVEEMRRLVGSAVISHLLMIAYLVISYQSTVSYSRAVIVLSGLLTACLAQSVRDVARKLMRRLGVGMLPAVVVGAGETARRLVAELSDAYWGFRPVGYFAHEPSDGFSLPYLGRPDDVVPVSARRGVKIVFVCRRAPLTRTEYEQYSRQFTHIEYMPTAVEFPASGSRLVTFSGIGGIEMVNMHQMPALRIEKWLLDKMMALVAFVVFSPMFVIVPILVKATSRGPVFYRQERLGKNGKPIRIWKFRSMYWDADRRLKDVFATDPKAEEEWKANFKLANDPRVTPLGKFLRKTSIDELPQLLNVFAGEMSLVGPRPIVREEVAYYGDAYDIFSSVLPGITGLWQASGRSDTDYARRVALDVHYVMNWSPWMDLWIVFRTVTAVVKMDGSC